jgi:hypothetical protein
MSLALEPTLHSFEPSEEPMLLETRINWMKAGVVGGFCASVFYPLLIFTPGAPLAMSATLAALLGPAIGSAGLGLHQLLQISGRPVASALGAFHNVVAGGLLTAMLLVQLAVRSRAPASVDDMVGVWLGLDVAWDIYVGLGTLFFAYAMLAHPRFRWPFALPGLAIGGLLIVLNLMTFPEPPDTAGLVDAGPLLGLWYLLVTVQLLRSLPWAKQHLQRLAEPLAGRGGIGNG